ncbi:MAG: protein phosphatase 2C domain-containing protein [Candidatus Bathyarchaeota archaeon]|nr:protein phosphatase 2C domain-containing protein [Candidatus Termiticorpusculum sp.]MCL2868835.1 protein phosphatase 2C domain-containing protein [Candidatus Termiticorpusculum sp.]
MIGWYGTSLIGRSHLSEGGVCQDYSGVKTLQNGWVVAAVADGLGSAKYSDIGSKLAVEEVLRFVDVNVPEVWHDESLISLLRTAFHVALKKIKDQASKEGHLLRYYDTTLTCVVYNGVNAVFGHVGDGGIIVLNPFGDFTALTVAQKGEEYNQTVPLRGGPDNWVFGLSNESIVALLLLTDGIYDVACPWLLAQQKQKMYVNYVRPFMDRNILKVKSSADFEKVQKDVEEFFQGKHAKQITDDKTIVGIINTDVMPEVKPDKYYLEPNWKKLVTEHREKLYGSNKSSSSSSPSSSTVTNTADVMSVDLDGDDDTDVVEVVSEDGEEKEGETEPVIDEAIENNDDCVQLETNTDDVVKLLEDTSEEKSEGSSGSVGSINKKLNSLLSKIRVKKADAN